MVMLEAPEKPLPALVGRYFHSFFSCYDRIPRPNKLQGERAYCGSSFQVLAHRGREVTEVCRSW